MHKESKHIKALKKGSYDSFTFFYNEYVRVLYSFVFRMTNNKIVAEDIVQETFLRIWINRNNIDEKQVFRNYLFTIARNILLNELRRKINQTLPLINYKEEDFLPNDSSIENETIENKLLKIELAKKKLPPRQLQLFEMYKEQELSVQEIKKRTKLSEQSIRNQIHLAIKAIRKHIKPLLFILFQ